MEAPGKGLLKVTSILFIIGGALSIILIIAGAALLGAAVQMAEAVGAEVTAQATDATLLLIFGIVAGVLELVTGIIGVKNCGDPSKASLLMILGVIIAVLTIATIFMGGGIVGILIGLVLPVLFIIGATMNMKKGTSAPAA